MNKNYFVSGLTITLVIKMWISCSAKRRPKIKIRKRLEPKKKKEKHHSQLKSKEACLTNTHPGPVAPD